MSTFASSEGQCLPRTPSHGPGIGHRRGRDSEFRQEESASESSDPTIPISYLLWSFPQAAQKHRNTESGFGSFLILVTRRRRLLVRRAPSPISAYMTTSHLILTCSLYKSNPQQLIGRVPTQVVTTLLTFGQSNLTSISGQTIERGLTLMISPWLTSGQLNPMCTLRQIDE